MLVVLYEAHVAALPEQLPPGVWYIVVHHLGNIRCAKVIAAIDHEAGLLYILEFVYYVIILQRTHWCVLIRAPAYDIALPAGPFLPQQALGAIGIGLARGVAQHVLFLRPLVYIA